MWGTITSWCSGRSNTSSPSADPSSQAQLPLAAPRVASGCATNCTPAACNVRLQQQAKLDKQLLAQATAGNNDDIKVRPTPSLPPQPLDQVGWLAQALLLRGASPNACCEPDFKTPLHYLAHAERQGAAEQLLLARADPKALDADKRTPLHSSHPHARIPQRAEGGR